MLLELKYLRETDLAVMFQTEVGETVHLPKSEIELRDDDSRIFAELKFHETCTVAVPDWLVEDRGLEYNAIGGEDD